MLGEKVSIYIYELQYLLNYYNINHKYEFKNPISWLLLPHS